ncbi:hypothetical protein DH2020_042550 [Rehmannia glutinosa]|uniref:CBS domain-containing protein n=1 Tax=Rehmannia glutinosa TaxID=99300 RepID=A0ABR0UNK1_REHGL
MASAPQTSTEPELPPSLAPSFPTATLGHPATWPNGNSDKSELQKSETPRSPEAKLGMQVEDLWDVQEPQLSPTEKLNACFESIPVSAFPHAPSSQVIEIRSDTSLAEAVKLLARHKILSAPVLDVTAPEDASWIDRYIGVVEFAGIVVWILHQSEKMEGYSPFDSALNDSDDDIGPAVAAAAASGMSSPREAKIDNVITQSAVIHMLEECAGLHWFESWGSKKLFELGLPLMKSSHIVKVYEDEPVLQAFKLMRQNGVGGVPVVASDGSKAIGNISIRDIQFLLIAPEIYKDYRSITAKNFLTAVRSHIEEHQNESPLLSGMVTCRRDDTLKQVIMKLDSMKIHRIYVVDETGNLEGVITLRDIISKLVHEPRGYFGDFFDGVLPLPANSRV